MLHPSMIGSIARAASLGVVLSVGAIRAHAFDESKYPDWSGQWPPGVGVQWDFMSADGFLMPAKKNHAAPDLRYFTQSKQ